MNITIQSWIIELLLSAAALLLAVLLWIAAWQAWMWYMDRLVAVLGATATVVEYGCRQIREGHGCTVRFMRWLQPRRYWRLRRDGDIPVPERNHPAIPDSSGGAR